MAAIIGAIIFGGIALLTLLVTLGAPLGEFTLGGKYRVLPFKMRIMSGISFVIQGFAILSILQVGKLFSIGLPEMVANGSCFFFAIYLSINTIMNFCSDSKKEKYVMTPLSFITAICFWIVAVIH
ncbi:hypothetical protein M2475_002165 [Breznakia sp. PF5-3]|uniref:hypothetical protein n=1 Tax=unclassified Breznakia TaxID=2623764 RepID=UPI0024074187|nr:MULTISPECIES: hypothetical protein [unclassified Breznakia]MDF9825779.1 hypothetical protein [Breznakia sp. PM6-1]MDF9836584.1 hypothetical protein [Breznakia sp. PF5-3]MDF9838812.1 hypothetical protein [Breznakia sp. PFB2-8]MDF9860838.1 hypothetical protein [Breznakia sp. PH5-24]